MATCARVMGFAPLVSPCARVLVLGTMPGVKSLREQQYYAHPRNAFWPIAAQVLEFDAHADYAARCMALTNAGIALWDVLQACERQGSLDANIQAETAVPNDFQAFLHAYPDIERVCFNGGKAAALYRRHVLPTLAVTRELQYFDLPSTSPAHAAMSQQEKLARWQRALLA
ncbi:DNA-deoxyinosine glycosylase [Bordetella sp. 15P40C-2]|uniref:DNA-deoxyinosine glycosylase n=1 Tax=Bordetella sp. 15P40C-2 TaxID=2572246 RepID=UPI00132C8025|nr:DNA-deoxyinosine glycosylase [Bordetella sp. 15P40C-2]MVW72050.1 DNA-deoxyinosine glycosylase [Bordetella sp. 15P40C-2]